MPLFGQTSNRENQRAAAWGSWVRRRNPMAIAALVVGLFSFIEGGVNLVFGIAGIVLGVVALRQLRVAASISPAACEPVETEEGESVPRVLGHRLAWAGIGLSVASLIVAGLLYLRILG